MQANEVKNYLDNVIDYECDTKIIFGASIDSRKVTPGNIFFGILGEYSDGNKFAQHALRKGASVVVVDDEDCYKKIKGNKILVDNSMEALMRLGTRRLQECDAIKIAVTGSYGKTSTKEMLKLVLSHQYAVYANEGNYNNKLGVCLTACGIPSNAEIVIFEIGSNAKGEIDELSKMIKPNIGILTGLGHAHIGHFGGYEAIAAEKISLLENIENGCLIVHESFLPMMKDSILYYTSLIFGRSDKAEMRLTDYKIVDGHLVFTISILGKLIEAELPYPFPHLAENFLSVLITAKILDMELWDIVEYVRSYKIPQGRGELISLGRLEIIDDTYNASLEAVERAIDVLSLYNRNPKYALIGEIGEIEGFEEKVYNRIIDKARNTENVKFIFSGNVYKNYTSEGNTVFISNYEDTVKELRQVKEGIILVKASRAFEFEKYIDLLRSGVEDAL